MRASNKRESIEKFDPSKVKKLSEAEIIERLKEEEKASLDNKLSGVLIDFDEIEK